MATFVRFEYKGSAVWADVEQSYSVRKREIADTGVSATHIEFLQHSVYVDGSVDDVVKTIAVALEIDIDVEGKPEKDKKESSGFSAALKAKIIEDLAKDVTQEASSEKLLLDFLKNAGKN